jgi:hypothetical protein
VAVVDTTPADQPADGAAGLPDATTDRVPVDGGTVDEDDGPDPLRFSRWMHRTATGALMMGVARGLDDALATRRRQPAFVVEVDSDVDEDGPIRLELDPDDPTTAVAVIRRPADPPVGDGD